jgi:hypothetical protein
MAMNEKTEACERCGEGPMHDGHLEVTNVPVLFWLDPGKRAVAGVRMRVCLACGHLEPYVDPDKLRSSGGL